MSTNYLHILSFHTALLLNKIYMAACFKVNHESSVFNKVEI